MVQLQVEKINSLYCLSEKYFLLGKFGSHVKPSYFLNVAYVVVPLSYAYRLLRQQRKVERRPTSKSAYASVWKRPLDVLFILYFVAAIVVAFLRGYVSTVTCCRYSSPY